jgi:uncharacterized repeat protein (TIGR01451 family)
MSGIGMAGLRSRLPGRRHAAIAAAIALAGGMLLAGVPQDAAQAATDCGSTVTSGATTTVTCGYTGAAQTWTVPDGITQATFTLYGAEGGNADNGPGYGGDPGLGAEVSGVLAVTPGTVFQVNVGQAGALNSGESFGGGGAASQDSGGGGGLSEVFGADTLLVAAGGGGGGDTGFDFDDDDQLPAGGDGGNSASPGGTGGSLLAGSCGDTLDGGGGGGAGSATAGGAAGGGGVAIQGSGCTADDGDSGSPGTSGVGGNGNGGRNSGTGGGGGGGYYGGGGGGGASTDTGSGGAIAVAGDGGGGGGSSYPASSTSTVTVTNGVASPTGAPDGEVIISYSVLAVSTTSLPDGTVGVAYSQQLSATSGVPPYTWSVTGGSLPAGLSLSAAGVLSGTPTASGASSFTVQAADSESPAETATQALTLTVNQPPVVVSTTALPGGTVGVAYSQQLAASGGVAPYSWSVEGGSLPAGLSLSAAGVLSGTPTAAGAFAFTVEAADSESPAVSGTQALTLTVSPAPVVVSTTSVPGGTVGAAYSQQLSASGGVAPYSWSVEGGSLPAGLSLSAAGVLSGTPSAAGSFTFTVEAADSETPAALTGSQSLTLTVNPAPVVISTTSLPAGTAGAAYSQSLLATGGVPPYAWSVEGGSLPAGLSLSAAGVLSGTPTAPGSFTFTVEAADSETPTALTGSQSLTLTVNPAPVAALAVSTASLPGGTQNTAYSQSLSATGGVTPYAWSVAKGSLPAGLTLSKGGIITGTPQTAGTFTFTVKVTDSAKPAVSATRQLSITIVADEANLAVSVTGPGSAKAGASVTYTLTVTNKGPVAASRVSVTLDTTGLTGVKASTGGTTKSAAVLGVTLTASSWSVASLAPGQVVTFTITGTVPAKGINSVIAAGTALSATPDPDLLNNVSTVTTKITA